MKNKLLIIIFALFLSLPSIAVMDEYSESNVYENNEVLETVEEQDVQTYQEPEINLPAPPTREITDYNSYKQPTSKKKIALKFLLAMFGVGISSFAIYGGLSLYNRIRDGFTAQNIVLPPEESKPLETPQNLTDAVKSFLNTTNWKV